MMPWVVRDSGSGAVLGSTRYHDIVREIDRVEIGYTWYSESRQRTHVNTACKRLLLAHAFETLGCQVVGLRTDNFNFRSQRAIEALGAKKDGVIRHHTMRRDGTVRDTVIYSILAAEWPDVRRHHRLAAGAAGDAGRPLIPAAPGAAALPTGGMLSGMVIGLLTLDLHFPGARSLKDKRQALRSLETRVRNRFQRLAGRGGAPGPLAAGAPGRGLGQHPTTSTWNRRCTAWRERRSARPTYRCWTRTWRSCERAAQRAAGRGDPGGRGAHRGPAQGPAHRLRHGDPRRT
jgi:hypothetical protein